MWDPVYNCEFWPDLTFDGLQPARSTDELVTQHQSSRFRHLLVRKDPAAPKPYLTDYNHFVRTQKETLKNVYKPLTAIELNRVMGKMWKTMSNEQKEPFVSVSRADRRRYEKEYAAYVPTPGYARCPDKTKRPAKRERVLLSIDIVNDCSVP